MKYALALLLIGSLLTPVQAREFKSADGEKSVEAEFVRYNPRTSKVTLRMTDGRNLVTDSAFFSEEDQAYFKEEYRKVEMEGAIEVRGHDRIDRGAYRKDKVLISFTDADYVFTIKNESDLDLKNVEVKYWVVIERYNQNNPMIETANGSAIVELIKKRSEQEVDGPSLRLITGAAPAYGTDNEGEARKMLNEAAKFGRDRDLGWRIEVYNSKGELMHAEASSVRVNKALGAEDKKD